MERPENEGKTAMLVARAPAGTDEGELLSVSLTPTRSKKARRTL